MEKRLVITRHGKAPLAPNGVDSLDTLEEAGISSVYSLNGGSQREFVARERVQPYDCFITHSPTKRTLMTGRAVVAGALGLQPAPKTLADLEAMTLPGVETRSDSRIYNGDFKFNMDIAQRLTPAESMRQWMDVMPEATAWDGVETTPFTYVISQGRGSLVDSLRYLITNKGLGVLATHQPNVEGVISAAVASSTGRSLVRLDEIGGIFPKGDYATIQLLAPTGSKSGLYEARLVRGNGVELPINLNTLLNAKTQ